MAGWADRRCRSAWHPFRVQASKSISAALGGIAHQKTRATTSPNPRLFLAHMPAACEILSSCWTCRPWLPVLPAGMFDLWDRRGLPLTRRCFGPAVQYAAPRRVVPMRKAKQRPGKRISKPLSQCLPSLNEGIGFPTDESRTVHGTAAYPRNTRRTYKFGTLAWKASLCPRNGEAGLMKSGRAHR